MKLSPNNREAQRLFVGLRDIDAIEGVKLTGKVTLNIAIGINRLTPIVTAFERSISKLRQQLQEIDTLNRPLKDEEKEENKAIRESNKAIVNEIEDLADSPIEAGEIDLNPFKLDNFKLEENPKIRGDHLASIAAIITDFDKSED